MWSTLSLWSTLCSSICDKLLSVLNTHSKSNVRWCKSAFFFRHLCLQMLRMHTLQHTHSDTSIPRVLSLFVFRSAVQGGSGTARAYSICSLHFLSRSPGFLFQVFIRLKSWTTHCFPLALGREQKRIEKKTREKGFLITLNNTPN